MSSQQFVPQHYRINRAFGDAARKNVTHGEEITLALGHLFAINQKIACVHPEAGEMIIASCSAGLSDLAFMVRKDVILATGMDVDYISTEHMRRHG